MRGEWALVLLVIACRSTGTGPYETRGEKDRDTARAQGLSREAADLIEADPQKAQDLLRQALTADLFYGPAHNNLGVLHLQVGQLYEAAEEFEWARKLMPGHPDPRMNLALTLEKAGRVDEAIKAYRTALEVYPGHVPAIEGLARLYVKENRAGPELDAWLGTIAMQGETEAWRAWAQHLIRNP